MTHNNKKGITIALSLLALLVIGGIVAFNLNKDKEETDEVSVEVREGEIEIEGEIACLPLRSGASSEDEESCVKGIKGDDGKTYALNSLEVRGIENAFEVGTDVKAIGTFEPADTANAESSAFSYDGVLVLRSLKKD